VELIEVVEVSDSTLSFDRDTKGSLYVAARSRVTSVAPKRSVTAALRRRCGAAGGRGDFGSVLGEGRPKRDECEMSPAAYFEHELSGEDRVERHEHPNGTAPRGDRILRAVIPHLAHDLPGMSLQLAYANFLHAIRSSLALWFLV
jgi:hypothetical protein